jgi:hypothetical protein
MKSVFDRPKGRLFILNRYARCLLVCLGALVNSMAASAPECTIQKQSYMGWECYVLSNGIVDVYVAPDIGGRVIQVRLGEHEFFWVNRQLGGKVFPASENNVQSGWKNYGGAKDWLAPQGVDEEGKWPGPPDPVLDGGRFRSEIVARQPDHVALKVTSPEDERSGVQFSRTLHLYRASTKVRVEHRMKNISKRSVRWGIWELIQHDVSHPEDSSLPHPDVWAYVPLNPNSIHAKGFHYLYGQANHPSFQPDAHSGLMRVNYLYKVGKIGLDSAAGWLAVVDGLSDHTFVNTFIYEPGQLYPDYSSVEFWINGPGEVVTANNTATFVDDPLQTPFFMESEVLSPFAELEPGEEYQFQTNWFVTRCPKPVHTLSSAAVISKPLSTKIHEDRVSLEGVFGVFHPGRLEAIFRGKKAEVINVQDLGSVHPNRVLRLSETLRLPQQTYRVELVLRDLQGRGRGVLGNVIVRPRFDTVGK